MKRTLLLLIFGIGVGMMGWGQVTVFTDDFSTNSSTSYTTSGVIGSSSWSVNRSGVDFGARRNTSPQQLELTNDASASANVLGWVFANASTSSFSSPYNTTLSSNTGLVTWYFNMRQIRTDPSGFGSASYGVGFILGGTANAAATTGNGYAVVLGGTGSTDPVRLVKYTGGIQTLAATQTGIIVSNTTGLTDFGLDYLSVKVTYNPLNNQWELFLRNDGISAFTDPTTGTPISQGTAIENTYTSTSLDYLGGYWQGSTTASQTAFFDNVIVQITPAGNISPTVTTQAVTSIGTLTATGNGNITATGGQNSTTRGVCWDAYANPVPDISDSHSTESGDFGTGAFTGSIVSVSDETHYQVVAYATNPIGTSYGSAVNFWTHSLEPSAHSTTFTNSVISQNQINLSFDAASTITDADGYIILQKTGSAPTGTPTDGNAYTVGNTISDATVAALVTSTSATTANITGLTANTNYYFTIMPFNWNTTDAATYNYYTAATIPGTNATTWPNIPSIATTNAATNITISSATSGGTTLNANGGTISAKGVVWNTTSSPTLPGLGSTNDGSGTADYVSSITGLDPQTQYYVRAYATNEGGTGYGTNVSFTTLSTEPTNHPSSFTASTISQTQIDLAFSAASTIANCAGYLILQNINSAPTGLPSDGTGYSAGNSIPTGTVAAIITNTADLSKSITGLTAGTHYYFKIFPYNWDGVNASTYNYKTDGSVPGADATTYLPNDTDSKVDAPASQISAGNVASTATSIGSAITVFNFKIKDLGTTDALATKVTQVTIKKSSGSADWTDHIAGAGLWDGLTQITTGTPVITDADITFPITSGNLDIANNSSKDITLKIWLNTTNIVDKATMVFTVSQTSHGFTADATGSTFATDFGAPVTGNTMTVAVTATKLLFTTAPSTTACPNTNLAIAPVVKALDANGAVDADFGGQITLTNSGAIGMTGYQLSASSGVATFTNLQFTETGSVTLSTTNISGLTNDGPTASIVISVGNVTSQAASTANASSVLSWTNPTCYDQIMIVGKAGSAVTATPTGDGTSYTANLAFGTTGTEYDGGYILYTGVTSTQTVTALTNGTTYHFTFFTRKGTSWNSGVTATATPALINDFFRSKVTGNWNVAGTWESSADGSTGWTTAITTPGGNNTVYIQTGHTITLTQNEACNSLNVSNGTSSGGSGADGVLQLATFTLEVNGSLRSYYGTVGTVPGIGDNTVSNMIITTSGSSGTLKIVGNSRDITTNWGAGNSGALTAFAVDISLNSGQTATLSKSIKAKSWIINSGSLDASVKINVDNGTAGDFTIQSGATVSSSMSGTGSSAVITRTNAASGGTLTVNGTLILTGAAPTIAMTTINFPGTVVYSASGVQTLAVLTNSGASPNIYTNLKLAGTSAKTLGVNTTVNGTLTMAGTTTSLGLGAFTLTYGVASTLEYAGSTSQTTANTEFPASPTIAPKNLDINNANGVTLNSDKVINGTVTVRTSAIFDASTYAVSGSGDFDVQTGATIKSGHANGLNGNNTTSGGLSSYSANANYEFNYSGTQITGSYLPAAVNNLTVSGTSDLTISNAGTLTVSGNLTIGSTAKLTLGSTQSLTVTGTLTNNATATGLVIKSDASGSGSLINGTTDVPATVERYITGVALNWHFLSSPVAAQDISGEEFTPAGSAYDFFLWDESTRTWINEKGANFATKNGGTSFVPGRGYLVAYQALNPTKNFVGNLNTGTVTIPLTNSGAASYNGSNLVGNPYASAIDRKAASGWTRSFVVQNAGGGYDMRIFNDASGNYGVYNSDNLVDAGTLGVTRYIPAGQGFMVTATNPAGSLSMNNSVRVHQNPAYLKSVEALSNSLRLKVTGNVNAYSDEIIVEFGHSNAQGGATKWNSMYEAAPSLYMPKDGEDYSINFMALPEAVTIPLSFEAGVDGNYSITASQLETFDSGTIINLEDIKTSQIQNLITNPVYTFAASTADDPARFKLHFAGTFGINDPAVISPVSIYSDGRTIYLNPSGNDLRNVTIGIFNLLGQELYSKQINLSSRLSIPADGYKGICVVRINTGTAVVSQKIFIN